MMLNGPVLLMLTFVIADNYKVLTPYNIWIDLTIQILLQFYWYTKT